MATAADRLSIITANSGQAVTELGKVGQAAERTSAAGNRASSQLSHLDDELRRRHAAACVRPGLKLAAAQDLAVWSTGRHQILRRSEQYARRPAHRCQPEAEAPRAGPRTGSG